MTRPRKPSWLHAFCTHMPNSGQLKDMRCSCSQWVVSQRDGIWTSWDPGLVTGNDVTVAVILDRRLARIQWQPLGDPTLMTVGERLDPAAMYLAEHICRCAPVSMEPIPHPTHPRPPGGAWRHPPVSDQQLREFENIWKDRK